MLTGAMVYDSDQEHQQNMEGEAAEELATAADTSEQPESWIFPGWIAFHLFGPCSHVDHQYASFEVGDWVRNKRSSPGEKKTETGGRVEQRKALAEQANTIRMNGVERGIPLTQLIESKQKQVASFTKLLHTPGMESEQKTNTRQGDGAYGRDSSR